MTTILNRIAAGTQRFDNRGETQLDEQGRCCGRKALVYKRQNMRFCTTCCAEFTSTPASNGQAGHGSHSRVALPASELKRAIWSGG